MIECPQCQNKEYLGAMFCSECGAPLIEDKKEDRDSTLQTNKISFSEDLARDYSPFLKPLSPVKTDPPFPETKESIAKHTRVQVIVSQSSKAMPLADKHEYTFGRVSGTQPVLPDIDLTAENAYILGVSRLHATIRLSEDYVTITDLGSANGTWINGKVIRPHVPHMISDEDIIHLGKLQLQVRIFE
jgi:FHA domain